MESLGATVSGAGDDAAQAARAHAAARPGCVLANNHPAAAEGAGTIGLELLRAGRLDTVVLPVGDGALITGAGRWIKARTLGVLIELSAAGLPEAKLKNAQPDGVTGDRRPNHCSASQASNRPASVNPNFAARRIERALAVWVKSTTGSPGSSPASQPSAAAHASRAYPNPHACGRNR